MMRIAFVTSRLISRSAAAAQRYRHSAGDHGNHHGKKGPFATRDKPMPEEPKQIPVVLSKRDKRIRVLRMDAARLVEDAKHNTKGYEKLVCLMAECRCNEQREILDGQIRLVIEKADEIKRKLANIQWELWSLGEWTVGGGGEGTGAGGGDETGGGGGGDETGRGGDVGGGGDSERESETAVPVVEET